ncbi:hypothetical protein OUZ56_018686 [Daphnia magna]|uniref:Uncharacterized protein n=1 Tax=Daphnia magna TaxID=35525 RepID=A0ABQ9Z9I8_9CRUS|nr:hypothetical protein OUZ56_018652 [Daphnia magna]KAK4009552.1 hypothetical protein OUZ56_018686 [Daphnia magna]
MGVTHDDKDTSKNTTQKTFDNTSKKNPKDDDIPATEQGDEDAKKVNSKGPRRAFLQRRRKGNPNLQMKKDGQTNIRVATQCHAQITKQRMG